jgi:RNA polymerase sigma-70 factor (ECF subfamily)
VIDRRGASAREDDPELCDRLAAGDQAAFEVLFQRHMRAIWNYTQRLTGSWSEAEDLTATTFLTAWRKREQLRVVNGSALPWLYTVARNLTRTQHRSTTRMRRALARLPGPGVAEDHADEVSARIDEDAQVRRLRAALPRLPAAEREAVELCVLAGLSTADAAAILGRAEVSVRSRLSRAKARLRTMLETPS